MDSMSIMHLIARYEAVEELLVELSRPRRKLRKSDGKTEFTDHEAHLLTDLKGQLRRETTGKDDTGCDGGEERGRRVSGSIFDALRLDDGRRKMRKREEMKLKREKKGGGKRKEKERKRGKKKSRVCVSQRGNWSGRPVSGRVTCFLVWNR